MKWYWWALIIVLAVAAIVIGVKMNKKMKDKKALEVQGSSDTVVAAA